VLEVWAAMRELASAYLGKKFLGGIRECILCVVSLLQTNTRSDGDAMRRTAGYNLVITIGTPFRSITNLALIEDVPGF
jgi:hypothetical protein